MTRYVDVAAVLDGSLMAPTTTVGGLRDDGTHLLYAGAVNTLVGPPEAGKTLIAAAMSADQLFAGGSVLWLDLDHNGPQATVARFRQFGVSADVLTDSTRFRLAVPEEADDVLGVVRDAAGWSPTIGVVDSVGELLPMFGASSNDADDWTRVNRLVMASLAGNGCGVLACDHETKSAQTNRYGATGTAAKKRTVDGAYLRVSCAAPFVPGFGGSASLAIVKDRHGHLRAVSPHGHGEQIVATFDLSFRGTAMTWVFRAPQRSAVEVEPDDVERLLALSALPSNAREAQRALRVSTQRATAALREARGVSETRRNGTETQGDQRFPFLPPLGGNGETHPEETETPDDGIGTAS